MPSGLIQQQRGVPTKCDFGGDFRQMQVHHAAVAARQDQANRLAGAGTDRTENVGRCGTLIVRRAGPGAAPRPAPGDLVLLPDSGLIPKPDLYVADIDTALTRDLFQRGREVFLNASMAPAAWAW